MAHKGYPLVGDAAYGSRRRGNVLLDTFPRQALHAWRLGLIHPSSRQAMDWESALPEDFSNLLRELRKAGPDVS
jgi:23S rRNA pseudouridine1911/1915/1917 synthase